jgi:hypothetical protein
MYLFGVLFIKNLCVSSLPTMVCCVADPPFSVLVFILTLILLAIDFYYLKNIAGRRLVGLRWWNEVNIETGESHWVFESSSPETRTINATDKRFFWLTMYIVPALWVGLAILAIVRLIGVIWLVIVGKLQTLLPHMENRPLIRVQRYSHRIGPDNHEFCCFQSREQIFRSFDLGEWGFRIWIGRKACRQHGWEVFQMIWS